VRSSGKIGFTEALNVAPGSGSKSTLRQHRAYCSRHSRIESPCTAIHLWLPKVASTGFQRDPLAADSQHGTCRLRCTPYMPTRPVTRVTGCDGSEIGCCAIARHRAAPPDMRGFSATLASDWRGLSTFGPVRFFLPWLRHCLSRMGCGQPGKVSKTVNTRGVKFGRRPKLTKHQQAEARERIAEGEPLTAIARSYNVSHMTICRLQV
jgi:hypothetical protein